MTRGVYRGIIQAPRRKEKIVKPPSGQIPVNAPRLDKELTTKH